MRPTLCFAATAALLLTSAPAFAQENWAGFYVGGNLGSSWGDTSIQTQVESGTGASVLPAEEVAIINAPNTDDDNEAGFTGGVQAGYNWQSGSLMLGIETDFGFFDLEQSRARTFTSPLLISPPIQGTLEQEMTTDWLWTVRPRIGYATPTWLLYATAGFAVADVQLEATYQDTRSPPTAAAISADETKTGWVAGVGAAYQLTPQWSVRGEWMYVDLGTVRASSNATGRSAVFTTEAEVHGNALRMGVDYRF